jgi:hypothetical protein
MRLIIHDHPDKVAHWVATYVKRRILAFAPTPDRPFVLGLPTGSSPTAVYQRLVEMHKRGEISFANVITFNMVRTAWSARVRSGADEGGGRRGSEAARNCDVAPRAGDSRTERLPRGTRQAPADRLLLRRRYHRHGTRRRHRRRRRRRELTRPHAPS